MTNIVWPTNGSAATGAQLQIEAALQVSQAELDQRAINLKKVSW